MSMGFMVAAASRKRDERGRYSEGDQGNRMGGNYDARSEGGGNYSRMDNGMEMRRRRDSRGRFMEGGSESYMGDTYADMDGSPEMRRRRDSRGRYMEGGESDRMEMGGGSAHYWPGPHMPPYGDDPEMRRVGRGADRRRNESNEGPQMGGYGGFVWDSMDQGGNGRMEGGSNIVDMRQYGRRYNPDAARMTMGGQKPDESMQGQKIGFRSREGGGEHLTREEAEEWVEGMESEDGKKGGRWSYQEIRQYAGNFGIQGEEKVIEFFAVMNALATDYGKVAKKHGVDKVDFWADMAKAFIHDKDANPGKVKTYYECIAKKDDE